MSDREFDTSLTLRLSKTLRARLDKEAAQLHLSTAAYARLLLETPKKQNKLITQMKRKAHREEYALIQVLLSKQNIVNNLNQIARCLHMGAHYPEMEIQVTQANQTLSDIYGVLMHQKAPPKLPEQFHKDHGQKGNSYAH